MSEMTTAEMVCGLKRLADICTREDEAVLLGAAKALTTATARAEKAEALYAKAWEECNCWRSWGYAVNTGRAHDAARREAGL